MKEGRDGGRERDIGTDRQKCRSGVKDVHTVLFLTGRPHFDIGEYPQ